MFGDVVNLYLLTECDMACKFCYASKDLDPMPVDRAKSAVEFFRSLGASRINLTGGEILMHPNALEVVRHAFDCGLKVTLFTSGSLYDEERIGTFSPYLDWLALSLDGDRVINNRMGRSKRHFDAALAALAKTRALAPDVKIRVATVVTRVNVDHLLPLAEILADAAHRPDLWRIKQMVPTRRAGEHLDTLGVPVPEFLRATAQVNERFGSALAIDAIANDNKEADTMCIHPDGACTVTVTIADEMKIKQLGNLFVDPQQVIASWTGSRRPDNASNYAAQWQRRLPLVS